jgi:hypothetical protein
MTDKFTVVLGALLLFGCAASSLRPDDLVAWKGRPVADLDQHPIFATMRMTRTYAADGTETRALADYSTGRSAGYPITQAPA